MKSPKRTIPVQTPNKDDVFIPAHFTFCVNCPHLISIKQFQRKTKDQKMEEPKNKFDSIREWIADNKLRTVGCLWLSGIAGSIAYNWSQPNMKTSVRIIHARLHAQALTLAALAGAAVVEYYDHRSEAKAERVAKFLEMDQHTTKD